MNKRSRIVPRAFIGVLAICSIALLVSLIMPVQANYDPQSAFTTEVLLNKPGVTYDLSLLENSVENGSVKKEEDKWEQGTYYIYRSHFNSDLGVIIYEVKESEVDLCGLSVSLAIPTEWSHNGPDSVLVPSVDLNSEELDWNTAMCTELEWLMNQSIVKSLTADDIQEIGINAKAGYAGWNSRIVYENDTWIPYNETEDPNLIFRDFSGFQLNLDDLPDGRPPHIAQDGFHYSNMVGIGAFVALVIFGAFSYTRLKRRAILDNLNRKNIFEHIKANPGVHFKKVLRELNFKPGALSYHLNVLEKEEYIKSIQQGNLRRFYLYGTKSDLKIALTSIQLRILSVVDERPGISQSNISKIIGKTRMLVNYHIKILADANILSLEKSGRESLCYTTSSATPYLPG